MATSVALGLLVGLLLSLTGAGGGILAVPLLIFFNQLQITEASQISLIAVGLSAALGAGIGLRTKKVHLRAALFTACAGMATSPIGIYTAHSMDMRILYAIFAATLLFSAARTIHSAKLKLASKTHHRSQWTCTVDGDTGRIKWNGRRIVTMLIVGSATGFTSGMLGIGGGFIMVPALQRFTSLDHRSIVATSLATITIVAFTGSLTSSFMQDYDMTVAIPFCAGTLAGMIAGKSLISRLLIVHTQHLFAAVCALAACALLYRMSTLA